MFNCIKATYKGFNNILVVNEKDVKQDQFPIGQIHFPTLVRLKTFTPHEKQYIPPQRNHKACIQERQDKTRHNIRKGPTAQVRNGTNV